MSSSYTWQQKLTSASLLDRLGMQSINDVIMKRRLAHVGCRVMTARLAKFGELNKQPIYIGTKEKTERSIVSGNWDVHVCVSE